MRMTKHKPEFHIRGRQRGAVILLVTFSLIAFLGLAALVLDFGRMYAIKSQLQNAADAGALRGAKELNGTGLGLTTAQAKAIEGALTNEFHLVANPLTTADITVQFAGHPFPASWSAADTACRANPLGCYFVRVDTSAQNISSFFAGVIGISTNAAKALAVAGRNNVDITPLAMCALDLTKCPNYPCTPTPTENCECGYERGKTYKVKDINPIGPGTMFWIDPVSTAPPCTVTSADAFRPYACEGKVSFGVSIGDPVYTNTGISNLILSSMDSRFGDYPPSGQCNPQTAPPDTNVKEYEYEDSDVASWMTPQPTRQSACVTSYGPPIRLDSKGVVWAGVRPEDNTIAGRSHTTPPYPGTGTPYGQTSGDYFQPPTGVGAPYATAGRRLMNLIIVDCPSSGGVCRPATVTLVGKFLYMRRADDHFQQDQCADPTKKENSNNEIYVEFARGVDPGLLNAEIKLYR